YSYQTVYKTQKCEFNYSLKVGDIMSAPVYNNSPLYECKTVASYPVSERVRDSNVFSIDSYFNEGLEVTYNYSPFILILVLIWFTIAWVFYRRMVDSFADAYSVTRKDYPELYNIVENLCISRGLPTPSISIINDESLNAYATGLSPKRASIAFSKGILKNLTKEEIEAVAAHELTHIINHDSRVMMIAIIFSGIIQTLAWAIIRVRFRARGKKAGQALLVLFIMKIVAFFVGILFTLIIQATISRKREFLADAGAVELTKTSKHLISALQKIDKDSCIEAIQNRNVAQICIDNPSVNSKDNGLFASLFSTHPKMSERIKALEMIG
ncbi:MAG: M48 family metallopeptidase, partial [Candidatus Dojkabacteria bacterium]